MISVRPGKERYAVGLYWVSTAEQGQSGLGLEARRANVRVLAAARLDRITRRAHTLSQLLEDGCSIRAADMPGAEDLMMRVYAAMAQKERELISERTKAALGVAKARGASLSGDRGVSAIRWS